MDLKIGPKDPVFEEILGFSNIFGFPAVNWAPKWTKTVNFCCIPFEPKFRILKDFSNTEFFLSETTYGQSFQQDQTMFWGVKAQRGPFHGYCIHAKSWKIFNFTTTYAILMKRTTDIHLNKGFHLAKSWCVSHIVYDSINKKTLKVSQKINFQAQFR